MARYSWGTPERVSAECGSLVEPGNGEAAALAESIERLARDSALRNQLGQAGRERACRLFTIPAAVEANMDLYRELLRGSAPLPVELQIKSRDQ